MAVSLFLLGSWAALFKFVSGKRRFEAFYFDYALGAIAAAAVLAWTAGYLGPDMTFVDRMAVAGMRQQATAIGGGFLFGIGNLLLLGAVALAGMGAAFVTAFAVGLIVVSFTGFQGVSYPILGAADVLLLGAAICAIRSRREAKLQKPARPGARPTVQGGLSRATKAAICAVLGGMFIGGSIPLGNSAFWGDLGLQPYAGVLLFCVGLAIATAIFGLMFLNIGIDGPRLNLRAVFGGGLGVHLAGWLAGIAWTSGILAWLVAAAGRGGEHDVDSAWLLAYYLAPVVAFLWGFAAFREFNQRSGSSKILIVVAGLLYAAGAVALVYRFHPR